MIRLKKILQSKYLLFIFILLSLIIIFYKINKDIIYNDTISGRVKNIIKLDTLTKIYIKDLLIISYKDINVDIGDYIYVKGKHIIPDNNTNFYLFNYNHYLKGKNIKYIIELDEYKKIKKNTNIFYKLKSRIINLIDKKNNNTYLKAFILGDKSDITDDINNSYINNGITHLFAISGMHISLLSGIILYILNKLKKTNFNYLITFFLLLFYCFLINFTPSITRSLLFFIVFFFNKEFKINIKSHYIVIYILLSFLIYNPYYIYNIGFLYSFIVSYFLIRYRFLLNNKHYLIKIILTSFISFIVTIPITINNNFSINLLSIINNVIFIPFISFILFPMILLSLVFPFLVPILNILTFILETISIFLSKISINITLCHINIYIFILYYIVIIFGLQMLKKKKYYFFILIYIFLFIHYFILNLGMYDFIHFINVGQGDSILIRLNKNNILIDTGGNFSNKKNYNVIIPYLKSFGITKLDYLILSHGDFDHMGEAINLVENFKVEKVILNCGEFNKLEQNLIKVLDKKKIPYYSCIKELNVDDNKLYFLNNKDYGNENDNSSIIYTQLNNHKFLFMGDAGVEVEEDLIEKYNLLNIDILKVGHHGSKTSSSEKFIDKISPKYSIISVGKNNRYGHPNKEVLENLDNSKIYRTDQDGSIMFKIKNNKLKIKTCSP